MAEASSVLSFSCCLVKWLWLVAWQDHQDSRATGDSGYAIEQQRRQTRQQMQEERDAHRDRAESRERELQDNIQQRRDEMLENLDRDASTGRGE